MTQCLAESDVRELARSTLAQFDREVAALSPELCAPFSQAAMLLERDLLTLYKVVVQIVRREEDLDRVASWWATMVSECDEFARKLHALLISRPGCGAEFYYDRVLDLRNKCQRLQRMHA